MAEHPTVDARSGAPRRAAHLAANAAGWVVLAIVAWFAWPITLHGGTSYVLVSGESMLPTYEPRDMVIARAGEPEVGDVIVYAPADLGGAQIVHRIIGGNADDGWVMQGDNNDFIDPFEPTADEVRGVVKVHLPLVGHVTVVLLNPVTWFFVLLLAFAVLIWPSRARGADVADDDDGNDDAAGESTGTPAASQPGRRPRSGAVMGVAALVAASALVTMASVTPASAAQLSVMTAAAPLATTVTRCANAALTATGSGSSVTVTGIPNACRSSAGAARPLTVFAHSATQVWSANVPAGATANAVTVSPTGTSAFDPAAVTTVVVKIDGWLFVAQWTYTAPSGPATCVPVNNGGNVPGGQTCTADVTSFTGWSSEGHRWANIYFTVSSPQVNAAVTLDLRAILGWTPVSVLTNTDFRAQSTPAPVYACSELPLVRLNRNTNASSWSGYLQVSTKPGAYPGRTAPDLICQ